MPKDEDHMQAVSRAALRPGSRAFTVFLGALGAVLPLSIDMGLPALPEIGLSLHSTAARAALTLTFFMAGFALAPIIFGPLSDRFGRRRVLLCGTAVFALSGAACAAAPAIAML